MEVVFQIAITVIGALSISAATWAIAKTRSVAREHHDLVLMKQDLEEFIPQHEVLMESQRNQLKAQVVEIYERAKRRKQDPTWDEPWIISYMELDTLNRLADSYFALGGNHYVHSIVKKANVMDVGGEAIPS